ncbi:hypothetical protein EON63_13275 [archaeon]|nr:MAG: hypothetical protein EON63_13275 [archaeon]
MVYGVLECVIRYKMLYGLFLCNFPHHFNLFYATLEWKFLVIRIYKAEGLPIMDGKVGIGFATAKKAGTGKFEII